MIRRLSGRSKYHTAAPAAVIRGEDVARTIFYGPIGIHAAARPLTGG